MQIHASPVRFAIRFVVLLMITLSITKEAVGDIPPVSLTPFQIGDRFGMQWDAISNATYVVQSTASLGVDSSWESLEPVSTNQAGPIRWMAPEAIHTGRYYRLLMPKPAILRIEPGFASSAGGATIYVLGQCLGTNGQVRIGGLVVPATVLQTGSSYAFTCPALNEGVYDVDWLENGQVIATAFKLFSVTAEVQPVGISQRLLEPPEGPFAAPERMVIKQKIIDYSIGELREATKHPAHLEVPNLRIATGEIELSVADLSIPGRGMDFNWIRCYRSRTGTNSSMGNNWTHGYDIYLEQTSSGLAVHDGTGRSDVYYVGTNGLYSCPELFNEGSMSNGVFTLTFPDSGKWVFNPPLDSLISGKLSTIVDRNGNTISLFYLPSGRLIAVVDDLGRSNSIAYNNAGRVSSVTDSSGRVLSYEYDANGDLITCISPAVTGTPNGNDYPGGKTNHYSYSSGFADNRLNHNLLSITDPIGQTWFRANYDPTNNPADYHFDTVDYVQCFSNVVYLRRIPQTPSPSNNYAVVKCVVNDPVGNVTERFYDSCNRCIRELQYTGRAIPGVPVTETLNRPTGRLRSSDPDFFESLWTWNADSCCAMYVNPRSIARQQYFFNESVRTRGNVRIVREVACCTGADTDGDGANDLSVRSWYFSYAPGMGAPGICGKYAIGRGEQKTWLPANFRFASTGRHGIRSPGDDVGLRSPMHLKNGWDGTIKGLLPEASEIFNRGSRQTVSLDGTFADNSGNDSRKAINTKGNGATLRTPGDDCFDPSGEIDTDSYCRKDRAAIKRYDDEDIVSPSPSSRDLKLTTSQPTITENHKGLFVSRTIDPQGNVSTAFFDPHGNCLETHVPAPVITIDPPFLDFAYNPFGQCVAVTNPPNANGYRRVDVADFYTNGPMAGYCRTFTVDIEGPTVTITRFEYDARGNITRCIDPRTNDWLCTWNALDQPVRLQTPTNLTARCVTDCSYDANDNLVQSTTEVRDQADAKYSNKSDVWSYNAVNRCIAHAEQVSESHYITNRFEYDGNGDCTAIYSPEAVNGHDLNNLVTCQYDERRFLFRQTNGPGTPNGLVFECSYQSDGYVTRLVVTDSTGLSSVPRNCYWSYDGFDRCSTFTDAMGNVCTTAFDSQNRLVFQQLDGETNDVPGGVFNARRGTCRHFYSPTGCLLSSHLAFFDPVTGLAVGDGDSSTTFAYAPNLDCLSITDDNQHTTRFSYDTAGRLSSITDPKRSSITVTYDPAANIINEVSLDHPDIAGTDQSYVRTFAFDNLCRCVSEINNSSNLTQYFYDSLDHCVRTIDARGHPSGSSFDFLGRCIAVIADLDLDGNLDFSADAGRTYIWDDNSNLLSCTDDNTNTTSVTYDSLNRWTLVQRPAGSTARCAYDTRDCIITNIDDNGSVITCFNDALGRCNRKTISPGSPSTATTTFEAFAFDCFSRCVGATNNLSVVAFSFDSLGNCTRATQDGLTTTCTFDGVGNCLSMSYPGGRGFSFLRDACDQVSTVSSSSSGLPPVTLASFSYDGLDRLGRISRPAPNNINTRMAWDGLVSTPNTAGDFGWRQAAGINHQVSGGGAIIDRRGASFDPNQNKILRAQLSPFFPNGPVTTNFYSYDAIDRLSQSVYSKSSIINTTTYQLDGDGNRIFVSSNGVAQFYSMDNGIPPGDFQMNRYTVTPFGSLQYDQNGNLIHRAGADGSFDCKYDYADRLVEVDALNGGKPLALVTFTYDALGRRISKTTYPPPPSLPLTTMFVYGGEAQLDCGGGSHILEQRSSAGTRSYVWGVNGGYQEGGDNEAVRKIACFDESDSLQYYHCDELGSTLAITDGNGVVLERYEYDDFGQPTFLSSDGSVLMDSGGQPITSSLRGNSLLFHGLFWDGESGLYFREGMQGVNPLYEDPKTGRSLSFSHDSAIVKGSPVKQCICQSGYTRYCENPSHADQCSKLIWSPRSNILLYGRKDKGGHGGHYGGSGGGAGGMLRAILRDHFEIGERPTQAQFATLIDSSVNLTEDRYLVGLREYDPLTGKSLGSSPEGGSTLNEKPKPTSTKPKELTGHVTLIK